MSRSLDQPRTSRERKPQRSSSTKHLSRNTCGKHRSYTTTALTQQPTKRFSSNAINHCGSMIRLLCSSIFSRCHRSWTRHSTKPYIEINTTSQKQLGLSCMETIASLQKTLLIKKAGYAVAYFEKANLSIVAGTSRRKKKEIEKG